MLCSFSKKRELTSCSSSMFSQDLLLTLFNTGPSKRPSSHKGTRFIVRAKTVSYVREIFIAVSVLCNKHNNSIVITELFYFYHVDPSHCQFTCTGLL